MEIAGNADCTLVVSNVEKSILEKEVPGVRVHEISTIRAVRYVHILKASLDRRRARGN